MRPASAIPEALEDDARFLEIVERHRFLDALNVREIIHAERVFLVQHHVGKFLL